MHSSWKYRWHCSSRSHIAWQVCHRDYPSNRTFYRIRWLPFLRLSSRCLGWHCWSPVPPQVFRVRTSHPCLIVHWSVCFEFFSLPASFLYRIYTGYIRFSIDGFVANIGVLHFTSNILVIKITPMMSWYLDNRLINLFIYPFNHTCIMVFWYIPLWHKVMTIFYHSPMMTRSHYYHS